MDAHSTEAGFDPAADQVEPSIPVLRPLLPTANRLLPYLARIDETRTYSNWVLSSTSSSSACAAI